MEIAFRQRAGILGAAPVASIVAFTCYCQLTGRSWETPVLVSLWWGTINTACLGLAACILWWLRHRLFAWVEESDPASLCAAAGVIFLGLTSAAILAFVISRVSWEMPVRLGPSYRWFMSLLPAMLACAVAVTAVIAAMRWRLRKEVHGPAAGLAADGWISFPEAPLLHTRTTEVGLVRTAGNYCEVVVSGRPVLIRVTAKQLEERLAKHGFVRINRGTIVNLEHVRTARLYRPKRLHVLLRDGSVLPVARSRRESFQRDLLAFRTNAQQGRD